MRTIAHISDIHFGTVEPRIADALVADINLRKPSLLVVSGDLTQRGRAWQYRAAGEFLARFASPRIVVPGNHDISLFDVLRRFFYPLARFQRFICNDLFPTFADDEVIVVGVNTARAFSLRPRGFWKDGKIADAQIAAVTTMMKQAKPGATKIVVTHHPFIPPPDTPPDDVVQNAARALKSFESAGVDLLLAGHLHLAYSGDVVEHHQAARRSMLSIQAGTATSDRRRGERNSYNWITIEPDRVTIEIRSWTGEKFDAITAHQFNRVDGAWRQAR